MPLFFFFFFFSVAEISPGPEPPLADSEDLALQNSPPSAQLLPPSFDDNDSDVFAPTTLSGSPPPLSDEMDATVDVPEPLQPPPSPPSSSSLPSAPSTPEEFPVEEETSACANVFEQCGGIELGEVDVPFSGPNCCESGLECLELNPFFSQCRYVFVRILLGHFNRDRLFSLYRS